MGNRLGSGCSCSCGDAVGLNQPPGVAAQALNGTYAPVAARGYERDSADPRKRVSQSAIRNSGPILDVLLAHTPPAGATGRRPLIPHAHAAHTNVHVRACKSASAALMIL